MGHSSHDVQDSYLGGGSGDPAAVNLDLTMEVEARFLVGQICCRGDICRPMSGPRQRIGGAEANEHLQAQVEYLRKMCDFRHGQRIEAKDVVEFQPFAPAINIPEHCQTLTLDIYLGDSDPVVHLRYFNTKMVIGGDTNAVKCRLLPSTFKGTMMT